MATIPPVEGFEVILPQGVSPQQAPGGFHWEAISSFRDAKNLPFTVWKLVKDADTLFGDLRDAFQHGIDLLLQSRIGGGLGGSSPTSTVYMFATSASNIVWTVDGDYNVVNVVPLSGSTNWALTSSGLTYNQVHSGVNTALREGVIAMYATQVGSFIQNTPIASGDKLTLSNNSASNVDILLYLTPK